MDRKTMKAGVLVGPGRVEIMDVPVPDMAPGMIRIRVSACGVCGSDIHMWKEGKGWSPKPPEHFIMGHEFCGVVTDAGDSDFRVGERVTFWANLYCGECDMCRSGREQLCRAVNGTNYIGFVCNGGYAEYFVGRAMNAYRLPDAVSDVAAGLAKKAGASVLVMSRIDDRQTDKAREIGDFDAYLYGNAPDRAERMREFSGGGFDVVFEAVGSGDALAACLDGVKPGGQVVMIGNSVSSSIPFEMNRAVLHEVHLTGSVSCTRREFEETIDLIARGIINPEKYVTDILPLDDLQHALDMQVSPVGHVLKTVIRP